MQYNFSTAEDSTDQMMQDDIFAPMVEEVNRTTSGPMHGYMMSQMSVLTPSVHIRRLFFQIWLRPAHVQGVLRVFGRLADPPHHARPGN